MGDSYRPSNRYGREYDYSERSYEYRDVDSAHRRRADERSRSPPRSLDYDDEGQGSNNRDRDYRSSREDGGYGHGDGIGTSKYGGRSTSDRSGSTLDRSRHDPGYDYRHYGSDTYPLQMANHGEKDGAKDDRPSSYVLVRGLKESVTEDIFAKGMEKLYSGFDDDFDGATPKSIRRVFIIRDRRTDQRMGYGFVQYHTVKDAEAAVKKARKMVSNGERLTISSKEFVITYAHNGVFPHADFGSVERNPKYLFQGPEKMHKYNDNRYYPKEVVISNKSPHSLEPQIKESTDTEKKRKMTSKDTLGGESKKKKTASAAVVPNSVTYYQTKQAELREAEESEAAQKSKDATQPATGVNAISTQDTPMSDAPVETAISTDTQTFAHEGDDLIACYLCNSQFKDREAIIRHVKKSDMHAKYLLESAYAYRAYKRMKAKGVDPDSTIRLSVEVKGVLPAQQAPKQQQYRDRAAERRQEEATVKLGFSLKGKMGHKPAAAPSSGRTSEAETEKTSSASSYGKGMGMLQKAGWSAGQGLGAAGSEGVAAPIETSLYAAGVGLGHEGSKQGDAVVEADRATRGNGFAESAKEKARKRYEEMNQA